MSDKGKSLLFLRRLCWVLLAGILAGCGAAPVTEDAGASPETAPAPQTVIALSRSLAEMWLLAGGSLAGVTEDALDLFDEDNPPATVGSLSRPSVEAIVVLEPDLVLLSGELSFHQRTEAELRRLGIPCRAVSVNSFSEYAAEMARMTGETGRGDLYEKNVTAARERIERVLQECPDAGGLTYLAMRVSASKNTALKSGHFACAMMDELGLRNIAGDASPLDDLNIEAIVAADPDWIFVIPQGVEEEALQSFQDAFASRPVWPSLRAVREGRLSFLPKEFFQRKPNARWDEAYAYLANLLAEAETTAPQ